MLFKVFGVQSILLDFMRFLAFYRIVIIHCVVLYNYCMINCVIIYFCAFVLIPLATNMLESCHLVVKLYC